MKQLLASTPTTDTIHLTCTIPGNDTLLLVMISSMKHIVNHPKSTSFPTNETISQISVNTPTSIHKLRLCKLASSLNGSYWSTKALGTKTELYSFRKPPPGEPAAPHTLEESNISLNKSKRKYDSMTFDSTLSLPT